jgi:hypothetical protein
MLDRFARVSALVLGLLVLSLAEPVAAWTNAHVRELTAEIEPHADGRAEVTLELSVDVQGGWLERLDLPGLDEDLSIDPNQGAWLVLEDGTQQFAQTRVRHGELELRFDRATAPRRGLHRLGVRYETVLAPETGELDSEDGARVRFALPGWEAGLERAEVRWLVDAGAHGVDDPSVAQQVSEEPGSNGKQLVRFVRVHVPRSTPWSVSLDLPGKHGGEQVRASKRDGTRAWRTGLGLVAFVLALGWLSRAGARRSARREGHAALPWGSVRVRRSLRAGFALLAALLWPFSPLFGSLCLLALALSFADRYLPSQRALSLGRFVPLTRKDIARARRLSLLRVLGGVPCTDLASGAGFGGFVLVLGALLRAPGAFDAARDPWGLGVLCGAVCLCTSSRLLRPRAVVEHVMVLAKAARSLVAVGAALRLCWYVPADGTPCEPRLRVLPAVRYPGLLRVELAAHTRRDTRPLMLLVVVEAHSQVDAWLARFTPQATRELSAGARRAVHIMPAQDPTEELESLFAMLHAETQRALSSELCDAPKAA